MRNVSLYNLIDSVQKLLLTWWKCCRVEWLIVDESDKLFEEGKTGFRDQASQFAKMFMDTIILNII